MTKTLTSVLPSLNRFAEQFRTAIENAARSQLDDLSSQVWRAYGAGAFDDDQAQRLQELIEQRRQGNPPRSGNAVPPTMPPRHRIQRTPEQRSPDRRASLLRRRELAATGPLPPNLAVGYTASQLACLKIIADEFLAHGVCDLGYKAIAARAGTCETVAKRAVWLAEHADQLVTVERRPRSGRKHLTNIIRIVRAEWLTWLDKGNRKAYAINACNRAKPDFPPVRGSQKYPPRSQVLRNSGSERVDKTGKKDNRTGAGRA